MIASFIESNHKEWDKYIPQFHFTHNTSVHTVTGKTPAFLVYGRELQPPKMWKRVVESPTEIAKDVETTDTSDNETTDETERPQHKYNTLATSKRKDKRDDPHTNSESQKTNNPKKS